MDDVNIGNAFNIYLYYRKWS